MEQLSEDIKQLISGYLTQSLTTEEETRFQVWLLADVRNVEIFNTYKATWDLSGFNAVKTNVNVTDTWENVIKDITPARKIGSFSITKILRIAAFWLVLMAIGSLVTLVFIKPIRIAENNSLTEIVAPLGAKSIVTLPDGTKIWLNAGSKLSYDANFNQNDRQVKLVGEAYFHVKTNKAKPFIVNTSDMEVRALGTRFNVKAYPEEKTITATLEEGKIDVRLTGKGETKRVELKPNENIVYYKSGNKESLVQNYPNIQDKKMIETTDKLEVQPEVKTILYTSWKEDKWIIEREPLSLLIPKLERRFNLNIEFSDNEIMNYKFTGSIRNETIEQILTAISYTAPIDFQVEKDKISLHINKEQFEKYKQLITRKN